MSEHEGISPLIFSHTRHSHTRSLTQTHGGFPIPEIAYVNGRWSPIAEAVVSIEDRGYQFGDGVYEVLVSSDHGVFLLGEHLRRLKRSAAAIGIQYDFERRPLEPAIFEGLQRCALNPALIYVQLTRGVAPRHHIIPEGIEPTMVITFRPKGGVPPHLREGGCKVITTKDVRWDHCFIKAITLLPNVMAKTEAHRRGCFDALFVTDGGEVRESTTANCFVVKGGRVRIPPRNEQILHGITQGFVMKCAEGIGIDVQEKRVDLEELRGADEVFLSSTTIEVLPVTTIDDRPVGDGKPGPVARRLYDEFVRRIPEHSTRA